MKKVVSIIIIFLSGLLYLGCSDNVSEVEPIEKLMGDKGSTFIVSLDEANDIANSISQSNEKANESKSRSITLEPKYKIEKVKGDSDITYYYIINFLEGGFCLLSADKRTDPILAFSDKGEFVLDDGTKPEGLVFWESSTKEMIKEIKKSNQKPNESSWKVDMINKILNRNIGNEIKNLRTVPPSGSGCSPYYYEKNSLGTPLWDQGVGYNNLCPYMSCSPSPTNGRAWTGCVATAMAEIMRFNSKPYSLNWGNMPTTNSPTSDIASLMKSIGNLVNMNYGCSGSGATMNSAKNTFQNSYGYGNATLISVNYEILKNQLMNNHPVMMAGGSHAWVCDGYKSIITEDCSSYLYLWQNWGWGGGWNGYYGVSAFNPSNRDYNSNVQIIYNLY